jgi:hypothetical protein
MGGSPAQTHHSDLAGRAAHGRRDLSRVDWTVVLRETAGPGGNVNYVDVAGPQPLLDLRMVLEVSARDPRGGGYTFPLGPRLTEWLVTDCDRLPTSGRVASTSSRNSLPNPCLLASYHRTASASSSGTSGANRTWVTCECGGCAPRSASGSRPSSAREDRRWPLELDARLRQSMPLRRGSRRRVRGLPEAPPLRARARPRKAGAPL